MNKLTLGDIVNAIPKAREVTGLLELLQQTKESQRHLPLPALIALYSVQDLYDQGSSDKANVRRITTNLEAAADELLAMSKLIKGLV